jgi:hypothetical protein
MKTLKLLSETEYFEEVAQLSARIVEECIEEAETTAAAKALAENVWIPEMTLEHKWVDNQEFNQAVLAISPNCETYIDNTDTYHLTHMMQRLGLDGFNELLASEALRWDLETATAKLFAAID